MLDELNVEVVPPYCIASKVSILATNCNCECVCVPTCKVSSNSSLSYSGRVEVQVPA
jgi:hypothetical protein